MTNQSFQIYKKKIKNNFIYYYHVYDNEGKRLSFSTHQKTKKKAIEYCLELFKNNELIPKKNKYLFEDYSKNWFIYNKCFYIKGKIQRGGSFSPTWAKKCRNRLKTYILPFFGKMEMRKIKPSDVEKWLLSLNNITNSTKNAIFSLLKLMFKEGERLELISRNPAGKVDLLKKSKKVRGILTKDESSKIFDENNFLEYWKGEYIYYLFNLVACCTGMRMGEIAALKKENIHEKYIEVTRSYEWAIKKIKCTKTGKSRIIPIPKELFEKIKNIFPENNDNFIFSINNKSPVSPSGILKSLYYALEKIGINEQERKERNITFHGWRHFFNTQLIGSGVDKMIVQSLTGHSSDAMTENYLHLGLEHFKEVEKIQENMLN